MHRNCKTKIKVTIAVLKRVSDQSDEVERDIVEELLSMRHLLRTDIGAYLSHQFFDDWASLGINFRFEQFRD